MLLLGVGLARRMPDQMAIAILGSATVYSVAGGIAGFDTLATGAVLVVLLLVLAVSFPHHRRLYAEHIPAFAGARALRDTARQLDMGARGSEAAARDHQSSGLGGVFYATLDACALAAMLLLARRLTPAPPATASAASGQSM